MPSNIASEAAITAAEVEQMRRRWRSVDDGPFEYAVQALPDGRDEIIRHPNGWPVLRLKEGQR